MSNSMEISVSVTGVIYILVCLAVVLRVPPEKLAGSQAPFSLVLASWPAAALGLAVVGMLAGLNGALIQIIMSSRVAYGLSRSGQGLKWFAVVHPRRQTPTHSTIVITIIVVMLALWFPIVTLAKATTTILLIVFALVNASLLVTKIRKIAAPEGCPSYPIFLPLLGTLLCGAFVVLIWFPFSLPDRRSAFSISAFSVGIDIEVSGIATTEYPLAKCAVYRVPS